MITEKIVLQSAGSFSVAALALVMTIIQITLFFRRPQFHWYGWSAVVSFSGMVYAVGIFIEYNTPAGPINRFGGLLEFTAILFLIHSLFGFSFFYMGLKAKAYHIFAGIIHGLICIFLWSTDYIVADKFVTRHFKGLTQPFIESALGPLGLYFELYAGITCIGGIILLIKYKVPNRQYRSSFIAGALFWIALGLHDGAASLGFQTYQYIMEYGFLGYSVVVLWAVFNSYVDASAEDKYRVISELANDGILVIQDKTTVFANQACLNLIGRQIVDTAAQDLLDVVAAHDKQKIIHHFKTLLHSKKSQGSFIICIQRENREERFAEIKANLIHYRSRPAVLAVIRDVTDRIREEKELKKKEEKLFRLKKMESLGLLAGGVAHDLNNVLAGVVSYPELLLLDLPEDSALRKPIETMRDSGKKAAAIVQDLLTVARGVSIPKEPLNLNTVIRDYLASPEHSKLVKFHPMVSIQTELDSSLFDIVGAPVHLGKAVMNLVSNAAEAIEGSGKVSISTLNRYMDKPLSGYDEISVGEYAVFVVEDDGPGIGPEDLNQIFEPFYTKKVMGRSGTGLGLTLVWNVVQDHQGYINVASSSQGTVFQLFFPITREAVPDKSTRVPIDDFYGNGETILVIDDVESQREISCRMLEKLRYKVKAMAGGEAAVEYLKEHRADLLLLDMIMDPGINGRETYEQITKIHPGQKAIVVSGFAETDQVMETRKMGAGRFLKKPIELEVLASAIQEELNR